MKKLYPYLAYAGTLPFILCMLCILLNFKTIPLLGDVQQILSVYALMITSFVAGSHWGQHLSLNNKWNFYLPITSNLIAVLLWIAFLVCSFKILMIVFVIVFLALLSLDKKLLEDNLIKLEYFRTRSFATTIAISSLIVSAIYA